MAGPIDSVPEVHSPGTPGHADGPTGAEAKEARDNEQAEETTTLPGVERPSTGHSAALPAEDAYAAFGNELTRIIRETGERMDAVLRTAQREAEAIARAAALEADAIRSRAESELRSAREEVREIRRAATTEASAMLERARATQEEARLQAAELIAHAEREGAALLAEARARRSEFEAAEIGLREQLRGVEQAVESLKTKAEEVLSDY